MATRRAQPDIPAEDPPVRQPKAKAAPKAKAPKTVELDADGNPVDEVPPRDGRPQLAGP